MKALALFVLIFIGFNSYSKIITEKRCGWVYNPTPGNYWLEDADSTWVLSAQGGNEIKGMDNLKSPESAESLNFVRTNINYGYYCACLELKVIEEDGKKKASELFSSNILPLKTCLEDVELKLPTR